MFVLSNRLELAYLKIIQTITLTELPKEYIEHILKISKFNRLSLICKANNILED